ncbi:hypothetical protein [Leucobacter celer]|uniref:hypothetical protein n=1 Tax=Leucobacter celer TaxID=668625 RepID=UPI0006A7E425|nr:hypothetical protein [Leucobacter celer]
MNPEHEPAGGPEAARSRLHPALAAAMQTEAARPADPVAAEVAEAERSMLAVHRDPTLNAPEPETDTPEPEEKRRTQVRWVRPTELAMQGGARATGWGLDLRAELGQRIRDARAERKQDRAERHSARAERLPDLSFSGRRARRASAQERSGMGLR